MDSATSGAKAPSAQNDGMKEALIYSKTFVILREAVRRSRRIHCRECAPCMDSATSGATAPFAQNDRM